MSQEEVELRDLITEKLSDAGILMNIKAQLRAAVLVTLKDDKNAKISMAVQTENMKKILDEFEGNLTVSLMKDFLQKMNLKQTLTIMELELGQTQLNLQDRGTLSEKYPHHFGSCKDDDPLIFDLLKKVEDCNIGVSELLKDPASSPKNKRTLPKPQDISMKDSKDEDSFRSDLTPTLPDGLGSPLNTSTPIARKRDKRTQESVISPYQAPQKKSAGSFNQDPFYDESFSSDKSSGTKLNGNSDQEESIKEEIEELDDKTESKSGDETLDSEKVISLDYEEKVKKSMF